MMRLFDRLRLRGRNESGGTRVNEAVHRHIVAGDKYRDEGSPALAARAYTEAVRRDPRLFHIWLQLGHALKDSGNPVDARAAYDRARHLRSGAGEPQLFLGQMDRKEGRGVAAARRYIAAAMSDDAGDEGAAEFLKVIGLSRPMEPAVARALIDRLSNEPVEPITMPSDASASTNDGGRLIFDVTDLIAHCRSHRRPTGIQRVELELSLAALEEPKAQISVCAFVAGRDELVEVAIPAFYWIACLAMADSDAAEHVWQQALFDLLARLFLAPALSPRAHDIIISLGTSWSIYDYFRIVRNLKARFDLVYVAFVHDLIPIVMPGYCEENTVTDYVTWFLGARDHVDLFLVSSAATLDDLLRAAPALSAERIRQIPFDVGFRPPGTALSLEHLELWNLRQATFALLVSTLEPRKNHLLAFDAWSELMRKHGPDRIPQLVCVGRTGWLHDQIFVRLQNDAALAAKVTIIDQVSDQELALLYRACCFLLYPSHYEGWGLPISEALSFGKVPIVADNSSLVEAGGGLAVTFTDDSVVALVDAVERVAFDDAWRERHEDRIRREYRSRAWSDVAAEIHETVSAFARTFNTHDTPPLLAPGRVYPLALNKVSSIADHVEGGERLRSGDGWLWPEQTGCRTKAGGGTIVFAVAENFAPAPASIYLRLRGLAKKPCSFELTCDAEVIAVGTLAPAEERWVLGQISIRGPRVAVTVVGDQIESVTLATYADVRAHEASIAVVALAWDDGSHTETLGPLH